MELIFSYSDVSYQISSDQSEIKADYPSYKGNFMKMKDLIETEILLKAEIQKNNFENENSRKSHYYFLGLLKKMQQYLHMVEIAKEQGEDFPDFGYLT